MPNRDSAAPVGAPCWVDLMTSDVERARAFYGQLFGWESEDPSPEFGGYFNFTRGDVRVAGGMPTMEGSEDTTNVWSVYLTTDDAEKTVEVATANGGSVLAPAMAIMELGSMAVITDNGGAAVGMWQPGAHHGFGVIAEHGAPSWFELHTRDYDNAVAFYRDVFRWDTNTMSDTPEFRYTTLRNPAPTTGDEWMAGIMDATAFLPDGVPNHWQVYFGADDCDAICGRLVELGGTIIVPAEDTPYGRIATVADPLGAVFSLVAPNEQMPAR